MTVYEQTQAFRFLIYRHVEISLSAPAVETDHAVHHKGIVNIPLPVRKYRFRPDKLGRAVVLSEFGGYNHQVFDHTFSKKDFGYKKLESPLQLENALQELYEDQIVPAWEDGLSAAVYTQLTDVEDELNGLITYDRKVVKIPPARMAAIVKVE